MSYFIKGATLTVGALASAFTLGLGWDWVVKFSTDKWEDLIVTTIGTLLGFGTALLLYLRQVADTKQSEQKDELRRHIEHVRWFSGILEQVVKYANQQADMLELFVDRIKKDPSENNQLAFIVSGSTGRLARANNEATFYAYNTVFAGRPEMKRDYLRLLAVTDFVVAGTARIKEVFEHYQKGTYERRLKLKALIESSSNTLNSLIGSMHAGGANARLFNSALHTDLGAMLVHYNLLIKLGSPLSKLVHEYAQPLKHVLLHHKNTLNFDPLWTQLKDATVLFTDIENDSLHFLGVFSPSGLREPAERLGQIHAEMEEGIRSFEASIE